MNDLRCRVVLQTDGQIKTGRDVVMALLLGAEEIGFATAPLVTLGCIMMRKCHLNTCPVGIATQDPELRKKFAGSPEYVVNYLFMVAEGTAPDHGELGFRTINEMVGRVDCWKRARRSSTGKRAASISRKILTPAEIVYEGTQVYRTISQDHGLEKALDNDLIELAQPALLRGEKVRIEHPIININRVVGTMLSHEVAKATEGKLLPDDTIHIKFTGSAGQSLGACLAKGVTLELEGDATTTSARACPAAGSSSTRRNPAPSRPRTTSSSATWSCTARPAAKLLPRLGAERFCVRNSGATAVVEGVGDHGCEYMTGGRVVVLGPTGRNFAAGMSGGIAYVWDKDGNFERMCNTETVELERVETAEDIRELRTLLENHQNYTGSTVAGHILDNWKPSSPGS